jgi:hypothetical protein
MLISPRALHLRCDTCEKMTISSGYTSFPQIIRIASLNLLHARTPGHAQASTALSPARPPQQKQQQQQKKQEQETRSRRPRSLHQSFCSSSERSCCCRSCRKELKHSCRSAHITKYIAATVSRVYQIDLSPQVPFTPHCQVLTRISPFAQGLLFFTAAPPIRCCL